MSVLRFFEVFRLELKHNLRRPLFWIMILILAFLCWGLSAGNVTVQSGDSSVGGAKAWTTSEFANARILSVFGMLVYLFFVTICAGMMVIQDGEAKVEELLHSTSLKPGEYAWGKYFAVLVTFCIALGIHLSFSVFFNHALAQGENKEFRGPFVWQNYVRPAVVFLLPLIVLLSGASLFIGAKTRKPILVFVLPLSIFLACAFFLWDWSPSTLPHAVNRVLMLIDPGGFRWLNETWLKVDRGVEFYNQSSIPLDLGFVASRIALVLVGLGLVVATARHLAAHLRGTSPRKTKRTEREAIATTAEPAELDALWGWLKRPLHSLQMTTKTPGFFSGLLEVARVECKALLTQPGIYLFGPLILLETYGVTTLAVGAFETPLLQTPGTLAARCMNTLTSLLCLLLMFYTVESLRRERGNGLAQLYYATPMRTASLLFGKAIANTFMALFIMLAALLGCIIVLLVQRTVPIRFEPFVILWGALLLPTFFAWSSFVAAAYALTRNRYTTYAICLALLAFTLYRQISGQMNWVGNWNLWSAVRWSDMGLLELDARSLLLNRIFVFSAGVLFTTLAVKTFPRREFDASRVVQRIQPTALLKSAFLLLPVAAPALASATILGWSIANGYQSEAADKRAKDYWRKNVNTFKDQHEPDLSSVDLEVDLEPKERSFRVKGRYDLVNYFEEPIAQIPLSVGPHFQEIQWTLGGEPCTPENRSLLCVFTPKTPLRKGETVSIGFSYHGQTPDGTSKNGGGAGTFILDSGIVLTSFGHELVPVVGFLENYGVDEDNQSEPKEYSEHFYEGLTEDAFGNRMPYSVRIAATVPEEFILNSVGSLVEETVENGRRRVVWQSDHPVSFFNLVGARYAVRKGEGTAIYYHSQHAWNIDEMIKALDGARRWYSEWFFPFPWNELKLSEFPGLSDYAQGFPTNITFAESIGFLTKSDPRANAAFMVTAHESAHQWWGNILVPGKGPGGNILSEGMSHFSTILLTEQLNGLHPRIELCKRFEASYARQRQSDSERPLVKIDGSRAGDQTVTYDKGGWVFWMLLQQMGREPCLAGLKDFIQTWHGGLDHPVLQDFVATMQKHATDAARFEEYVRQWFYEVVVPEYRLSDGRKTRVEGTTEAFEVHVKVTNIGTGRIPIEVAAIRERRFDENSNPMPDYRESRVQIVLGPNESQEVIIRCDFEPESVLVDPDALVLQLERHRAEAKL